MKDGHPIVLVDVKNSDQIALLDARFLGQLISIGFHMLGFLNDFFNGDLSEKVLVQRMDRKLSFSD